MSEESLKAEIDYLDEALKDALALAKERADIINRWGMDSGRIAQLESTLREIAKDTTPDPWGLARHALAAVETDAKFATPHIDVRVPHMCDVKGCYGTSSAREPPYYCGVHRHLAEKTKGE